MDQTKQKFKTKKLENVYYECEWEGCECAPFKDLFTFLKHVRHHAMDSVKGHGSLLNCDPSQNFSNQDEQMEHNVSDIQESSDISKIKCYWSGCFESGFDTITSFILHVSYHGFHSKLMSWGNVVLREIAKTTGGFTTCRRDSSERCMLPELSDHFVCHWEDCLEEFQDAEAYYRHIDDHALDIPIPSLSKDELKRTKFAVCRWIVTSEEESSLCNMSFLTKSHLKNHLRSHSQEKIVACPTCGMMFCDRSKFTDHILRQQPLEANNGLNCSQCNAIFFTNRLLREHVRKFHSTRVLCQDCGHVTDSLAELKRHVLYKHSDERPFSCQFCESRFKSRSDLRRHIYTHNDGNPFKCPVPGCDYETRSQEALKGHQKRDHQDEKVVFQCHLCPSFYARGNYLTRHLINKHDFKKKVTGARFKYYPDPQSGVFTLDPSFNQTPNHMTDISNAPMMS